MEERKAKIKRETQETAVALELKIDGNGEYETATGLRMFDHLLSQFAMHGVFDLKASATGPDPHHVVEDVALCLGRVFNQAVGDKRGIVRMGHALVPMDDALAMVAIDISGRGYSVVELTLKDERISDLPSDLVKHFFDSFAVEARLTLHAQVLRGDNDHHKVEALFKAFGRALDQASRYDSRLASRVPSTKDLLD